MGTELTFGQWLKRRRRALDLTQRALGERAGYSAETIRKVEAGDLRPSRQLVEHLAGPLEIQPDQLINLIRFARGDTPLADRDQPPAAFPAPPDQVRPPPSQPARHHLPAAFNSFIGRESEHAALMQYLAGPSPAARGRLVTLTGPGGCGKTRLSLAAAADLQTAFVDGLWFVDLAPLSDPQLITATILQTIGLVSNPGRTDLATLTRYLSSIHALLILDNCEHIIEAVARTVEALLHACPRLFVLATSREALGLPGERRILLRGLATPDLDAPASLARLAAFASVRLFIDRAQAALRGFQLTAQNGPAVAQVCARLDGIPLAIELAAARVSVLRVEQIAARLAESYALLNGGRATAQRQQTLRAAIDWSYDLLTAPEQTLFCRLSVFVGGWTLEGAEAVCADNEPDGLFSTEILDNLSRLVDKSLVVVEHQSGAEARYHLLETIRQYARHRLARSGESDALGARHLAYYLNLAESAEPELRGPAQVAWLDRLEAELDNIRAALEWSTHANVAAGLRLASALKWLWWIRDFKSEGYQWLERLLSLYPLASGESPLSAAVLLIRGSALNAACHLKASSSTSQRLAMLDESLALHRQAGPAGKRGLAYALAFLGGTRLAHGDTSGAALLERSLALFRALGDKFGMAECLLDQLGQAHKYEPARANELHARHVILREAIGDQDGLATALKYWGDLSFMHGDHRLASQRYALSLAAYRAVRNQWGTFWALSGVGDVYWIRGDYDQADRAYSEAVTLSRRLGDRFRIEAAVLAEGRLPLAAGDAELGLGRLALATGRYAQASAALQAFEAAAMEAEAHLVAAWARCYWAKARHLLNDLPGAAAHYQSVLQLVAEAQERPVASFALAGLGQVELAGGDLAAARAYHRRALALRQIIGFDWLMAESLADFAALVAAEHHHWTAAALYGAAETGYRLMQYGRSPRERAEQYRLAAFLSEALGEADFTMAVEAGRRLAPQQAMAMALEGPPL